MNKRALTDIDKIISKNLYKLRRESGHSQQYVAERLGVTFQQIQKYERGTNRIPAGRLYHLADILSVPIERFFYLGQEINI